MHKSKKIICVMLSLIGLTISLSFNIENESDDAFRKLKLLRLKALKLNVIGRLYEWDLTGIVDCNKTKIKYLGIAKTSQNKNYKILTSFFVQGNSCRGTSRIVIYDTSNNYIGNYYVGMPDNLPDTLVASKLIYFAKNADCKFRNGKSISLVEGLPQSIYIPCEEENGESFVFSSIE